MGVAAMDSHLTVGKLIDFLKEYPANMKVVFFTDDGFYYAGVQHDLTTNWISFNYQYLIHPHKPVDAEIYNPIEGTCKRLQDMDETVMLLQIA
jgi:hypothetical protein